MTVTTTASAVTFQGNGATSVFPYNFLIPGTNPSDQTNALLTLQDSVAGTVTTIPDGNYSMTGIGADAGTFTYPLPGGTPIPATQSITLQRVLPIVQNLALPNQTAFYGPAVEDEFDYLTLLIQQLQAPVQNTIHYGPGDGAINGTLPPSSLLKGQLLGFDPTTGAPVAAQPTGALVSAAMQPIVLSASVAVALARLGGIGTVASVAALRVTTLAVPALFLEGYATAGDGGDGVFVYVPGDTTSADNGGTIIVNAGGYRYYREYGKGPINLAWFGADPTNTADCTAEINAWFALACSTGQGGYVPDGIYNCAFPIIFDVNSIRDFGIDIFGAGKQQSIFNSTSGVSPLFSFECSGGTTGVPIGGFYSKVLGLGFRGNVNGVCVAIGKADLSDQLNEYEFDIYVTNANTGSSTVAIQVNGNYNNSFFFVGNNSGSAGDALQINAAAFCDFRGSFGNANIALHLTNGFSYGNNFFNLDLEVVNYCVVCDSAQAINNTFHSGQWNWNTNALNVTTGRMTLIEPNFSESGATIFAGTSGARVVIKGFATDVPVGTPTFPTTTTVVTNTTGRVISAFIYDGAITQININAAAIGTTFTGVTTVTLNPGDTIAVTYTGTPAWLWFPII